MKLFRIKKNTNIEFVTNFLSHVFLLTTSSKQTNIRETTEIIRFYEVISSNPLCFSNTMMSMQHREK